MAAKLGCKCAQCLEDNRDIAQYYMGQPWANTQQAIYNDREGRYCAHCWGKAGTRDPLVPYFSPLWPGLRFSQISSCCLGKLRRGQLYTGNPTTGIPPFPLYPNVWPRIPPEEWWEGPTPEIEW